MFRDTENEKSRNCNFYESQINKFIKNHERIEFRSAALRCQYFIERNSLQSPHGAAEYRDSIEKNSKRKATEYLLSLLNRRTTSMGQIGNVRANIPNLRPNVI